MKTPKRSRIFQMKNLFRLLVSALALGTMPLYAAGTGTAAARTASTQPAFDPMALARGAQQWSHICGSCHGLRDPKELTDAEWDVAMGQMSVRIGLTAEQFHDISLFLKTNN